MYAFEYHRPSSLAEAATLLAGRSDEAKLLAGGMTYIPTLKQRLAQPSRSDRPRPASPSSRASGRTADGLAIGAMTTPRRGRGIRRR